VTAGLRTWTYPATTAYNQVPSRTRGTGGSAVTDTFVYDAQSRQTQWNTTGAVVSSRTYTYDGVGRLRQVVKTGAGAVTEKYWYDVDDNVPYEERTLGGVLTTISRHEGWERRTVATVPTVTEQVLPMASIRGTELVVLLKELDGHALVSRGSVTTSMEALGAFGLRLSKYNTTPQNWVVNGYHGEEVNREAEVVHKGARHLSLRDGMWMQPEPLLYLGVTAGDLRNPVGYSGVYAAGDSNALQDRSGMTPLAWLAAEGLLTAADVGATFSTGVAVVNGQATVTSFAVQLALTGFGMMAPTGGFAAGGSGRQYRTKSGAPV
jgi:hypothetical protein